MTGQTMIRLFLALLLACAVIWGCGGAELPAGRGLVFSDSFIDVGERWSGEEIEMEFPFAVVESPVAIDTVLAECSCLDLELWVNGAIYDPGDRIPAGSEGVLKVLYKTAGFSGRKFVGINLRGAGEGLNARVEVRSWLRSWFTLEPGVADFGVIDGEQEQVISLEVSGQEAFRITKIISQSPPLQVRGVPTGSAKSHVLEVVLPPTTAEGRHAGFFSFATDHEGYTFRLAVGYEVAGDLWTMPDSRLLLGQVNKGVEHFSVIEVGARSGSLETPTVELVDLPGAASQVEKLAGEGRYRVHLKLVPESAKIAGEVRLTLPFTQDGERQTVIRAIQVFGVVRQQ